MTTPDAARITRPEPQRTGPDRSGSSTAAPPSGFAAGGASGEAPPVRDADQLSVNNAVAASVKTAYDVLADTVEQGRRSAEQFRIGAYNVRDVPDDVRHLAGNLLSLARQLSSATFDICEALLRTTGGTLTPPPPGSTPVPPFQEVKPIVGADPAAPASTAAPAAPPPPVKNAASDMRLSVQIIGADKACAHSASVARPSVPTAPSDIACTPLTAHGTDAPPLTAVQFEADLVGGGLAATVTVPPGQPAGIYAGAIYCTTQKLPLGQLVIEIG